MVVGNNDAAYKQVAEKLRFELGQVVTQALEDPDIQEIMCNSDGRIWVDHQSEGMKPIGTMSAVDSLQLLNTFAHSLGTICTDEKPIVEGALILDGSRFEGLRPPVVRSPTWTLRKRATRVYTLDDYVDQRVITTHQASVLLTSISERRNILIAGGTSTGKTTFANALIHAIVAQHPTERLVIIEDTPELQCSAENAVLLETSQHVSMTDLLKATMRLRPDRILVGEVRDGAALTLLKAWNTGHPGGVATVHASSLVGAALRMQALAAEAQGPSFSDLEHMVDETLDLTVVLKRHKDGSREITAIGHHKRNPNGFIPQRVAP